jgi:hypothetical protein
VLSGFPERRCSNKNLSAMTIQSIASRSGRSLLMQKAETAGPRKDTEREMERADIQNVDKNGGADLKRGEGGTLGPPTKPEGLSHDD